MEGKNKKLRVSQVSYKHDQVVIFLKCGAITDLTAKVLDCGHFVPPPRSYLAMPKDIFGGGCYRYLVGRWPRMQLNIL